MDKCKAARAGIISCFNCPEEPRCAHHGDTVTVDRADIQRMKAILVDGVTVAEADELQHMFAKYFK